MNKHLLQLDVNGFVQEKFVRFVLIDILRSSNLIGKKFDTVSKLPAASDVHKIYSGLPEEYADYFIEKIRSLSNFKADYERSSVSYNSNGVQLETRRIGLFCLAEKVSPTIDLFDPEQNLREGIRLYTNLILKDKKLPETNSDFNI